jgi:hypothetical protein
MMVQRPSLRAAARSLSRLENVSLSHRVRQIVFHRTFISVINGIFVSVTSAYLCGV